MKRSRGTIPYWHGGPVPLRFVGFRRTGRSPGVSLIIDNELPGKFSDRVEGVGTRFPLKLQSSRANEQEFVSVRFPLLPSTEALYFTGKLGTRLEAYVINSEVHEDCRREAGTRRDNPANLFDNYRERRSVQEASGLTAGSK